MSTKEQRIQNAVDQIANWADTNYCRSMKMSLTDTLDKWLSYFLVKHGNFTWKKGVSFKSVESLIAKMDIFTEDMFPWQSEEQKKVTTEELVTLIEMNKENVEDLIDEDGEAFYADFPEVITGILGSYDYEVKHRANAQYISSAIRRLPEFIKKHGIESVRDLKKGCLYREISSELAPIADRDIVDSFFCDLVWRNFKLDELIKAVNTD